MIDKNNYELYIIDYLDGKLSLELTQELLLFIDENEEVKTEFELLKQAEKIETTTSLISPIFLQQLKKTEDVNIEVYYDKLIAKLEGDASPFELIKTDADIAAYKSLKTAYEQFKQTKLIANKTIIFKDKNKLKKQYIIIPFYKKYAAITSIAAMLIMLIAFFIYKKNIEQTGVGLLSKKETRRNVIGIKKAPLKKQKTFETNKQKNNIKKEYTALAKQTYTYNNVISKTQIKMQLINIKTKPSIGDNSIALNNKIVPAQLPTIVFVTNKNVAPIMAQNNYLNPQEYLQKILDEKINKLLYENKDDKLLVKKNKFAYVLLNLFNKATGADVRLVAKYNKEGKISGYSLSAKNIFAINN